jgi:predicted naringenin-chalcone synthase
MNSRLVSVATAFPERSWTQRECWEVLKDSPSVRQLKPRSVQLLEKVLTGDSGIERRHFATNRIEDVLGRGAQALNETYEREATALGAAALQKARGDQSVDALFVCSCTGFLCPGLSSHIAERVGLGAESYLLDHTGAGCGAAIPTLRAACNYLAVNPSHRVAVVAVEVCSAAFYLNDEPGVLISLCLFGDGAAAVVLDAKDGPGHRFSDFHTLHLPEQREKIRFVNRDGYLCNQLDRAVPEVAAAAVEQLYSRGVDRARVISHAAGRDVLNAIRSRLPDQSLSEAVETLRIRGNVSSPSVLIALEAALQKGSEPLWLTSFGAGFSAHACRLA